MFLVKYDEIKNRLREYFDKLFNEESDKPRLTWTIHLMTPICDLFEKFKSLR
jgi:hypothetical protein